MPLPYNQKTHTAEKQSVVFSFTGNPMTFPRHSSEALILVLNVYDTEVYTFTRDKALQEVIIRPTRHFWKPAISLKLSENLRQCL